MKRIVLFLLLLGVKQISFAQSSAQLLANNLAKSYLKNKNGSLVIGIYDNGRQKLFYYGETEKGNAVLPDSNSIFEIGNITETFTCLLYIDRTLKGIMHIDDKLQSYLPVNVPSPVYQPVICKPSDKLNDYGNDDRDNLEVRFTPYACLPDTSHEPQPILLCYLASHTSGLPDLPDNLKIKNKSNPYSDYSTDDLYDFLRGYRLEHKIGFDYRHSDLGITLLGKAISLKMNKDFESVLVENILDSLQMKDTRISLSENQKKRLLNGYNLKGNKTDYWTYDALAPSGALHSSAADMMKFLSANIAVKKNYYSNLLDYSHNPRLKPGAFLSDDVEIALGWKITPLEKDNPAKVVWQKGLTGGFSSYIGFVETSHTGIIILSSSVGDVNEMGLQLLRLIQKEKLTE